MTIYTGHFTDRAPYDSATKTALSVRDGVIEYLGSELGMEPPDKLFTVYRSPATIANAAPKMVAVPVTQAHVSLDEPAPPDGGMVESAEMIDVSDPATDTTIAIRNTLAILDALPVGELSLGYLAELRPHDRYDFEQTNIQPHHLAIVPAGRCGPMCCFLDAKPETQPEEPEPMAKPDETPDPLKAFKDADGSINMAQIAELLAALPEAIKTAPVADVVKIVPQLQAIVEAGKTVAPELAEEETPAEEMTDEEGNPDDEEKAKFADAKSRQAFVDEAVQNHTAVVLKAREFLDESYEFKGKSTTQIMTDAVRTQYSDSFSGAELSTAFKMLKKPVATYEEFGDRKPGSNLQAIGEQEIQ